MRLCAVELCGRAVRTLGYCDKHYRRVLRNGDPLGGRVPNGEAERYLREVVLAYDGDDCLPWPFAKNTYGYGKLWLDGRAQIVSRMVCERTQGPPPTPEHEAAHSCGNGHEACCTKRHLSWKTHAENMADLAEHIIIRAARALDGGEG